MPVFRVWTNLLRRWSGVISPVMKASESKKPADFLPSDCVIEPSEHESSTRRDRKNEKQSSPLIFFNSCDHTNTRCFFIGGSAVHMTSWNAAEALGYKSIVPSDGAHLRYVWGKSIIKKGLKLQKISVLNSLLLTTLVAWCRYLYFTNLRYAKSDQVYQKKTTTIYICKETYNNIQQNRKIKYWQYKFNIANPNLSTKIISQKCNYLNKGLNE